MPMSRWYKLYRKTDPVTSQMGAASVEAALDNLHAWTVRCVTKSPGRTQRELGRLYCPTDPRRIGRRLVECERMGTVIRGDARRCSVSGRMAETWWPAESHGGQEN